jgi:DNA polymerase-3 subunit delta
MMVPLLYIWGDDDLAAARLVDRFAAALATASGGPLDRWEVRGELATAATQVAQLHERVATPAMFGGGTLAIVTNPGALTKRNDTRDALLASIELIAAGNGLVVVEASKSDGKARKAPGQKRLSDAVRGAGGQVVAAFAIPPQRLDAWIEEEARDRRLALGPGAARELADRLGSRVTEGDVERRHLTRIASTELDKLALRHAIDGALVSVDDVRALVAESTPGSVWALTDALGDRRREIALVALDRLIDGTPEPVLLAALHKRVRDLLEVGDRLAAGEKPSDVVAATGLHPFVAEKLAGQARNWTADELRAALTGLLELDAMVKGAPGSEADAAQRRLAFTVWVGDHAGRPMAGTARRQAVSG